MNIKPKYKSVFKIFKAESHNELQCKHDDFLIFVYLDIEDDADFKEGHDSQESESATEEDPYWKPKRRKKDKGKGKEIR